MHLKSKQKTILRYKKLSDVTTILQQCINSTEQNKFYIKFLINRLKNLGFRSD